MDSTSQSVEVPRFTFPFKVHILLEDAANEGNSHIVSWLPHGHAFKIFSKELFETDILPRYFTSSMAPKYRSFSRQLAIYGFKFVTDPSSPDHRSYRHPLMVRGNPALCMSMARQKIKGKSKRRSTGKHSEKRGATETSPDSKELSEDQEVISRPILNSTLSTETSVKREQTLVSPIPIASLEEEDTDSDGQSQDLHHDILLDFAIYANEFLEKISARKLLFGEQPSDSLGARLEPSMISKIVSQSDRNLHLDGHSHRLEKERHSGGLRLPSHSKYTLPATHRNPLTPRLHRSGSWHSLCSEDSIAPDDGAAVPGCPDGIRQDILMMMA